MANYSVTFARSARKELEKLHPSITRRVMQRIEALATIPRPSGVIRLQGHTRIFGEFELESIESEKRTFCQGEAPLRLSIIGLSELPIVDG